MRALITITIDLVDGTIEVTIEPIPTRATRYAHEK